MRFFYNIFVNMESENFHFRNKTELAERYNICVKTLNKYLARIEAKLPLYVAGDCSFTPAQVKVIDYHLVHIADSI